MAAPTLIATAQIDNPWAQTANIAAGVATKAYSSALTTQAGDLIVAMQGGADAAVAVGTLSASGSLNGAYTNRTNLQNASHCSIQIASVASGAGSETVTLTRSLTGFAVEVGGAAFQFRNHGGIGNISAATDGAQSGSITCSANSALLVLVLDWNATTGTRTWANINGSGPTSTFGVDGDGATWAVAGAYWADVGAAGSKTFTLTAPTFGAATIAAIEILAGASGPTITAQPTDQTVNAGATASFSVTATGATSYQWQDDSGGSFADISGATSSSYVTSAATYAMQGRQYRCVVTNANGSVNSDTATLRVAWNLTGTGPRAYPGLGGVLGAGTVESWLRGSVAAGGGATIAPGKGSLTLSGKQPTITQTVTTTVAPGKGALTLTGYAPGVARTIVVAPGKGTLLLSTYAPTIARLAVVAPGKGILVLTGYAPSIVRITALTPGKGSLALTGYTPTVSQSSSSAIAPGKGALTLSGYAPTVSRTANQAVSPGAGNLLLTGYAPSIAQSANQAVGPGKGSLLLTGYAPSISSSANQAVSPGAGNLLLTGYAPTVARTDNQVVAPGRGRLALTGYAPAVSTGGAVFPLPGQVQAGVVYGPTGVEYTGTLVATGGSFLRRR